MSRRNITIYGRALVLILFALGAVDFIEAAEKRPNILLCIADDASAAHFGANGDRVCRTPTFDRIAKEGVNFRNAFCSAPSCTPSRGALLTGQDFWRLQDGGNLWSRWPNRFPVYTDILAKGGYHVGLKGKGWGPGEFKSGGRENNPAGPPYRDFETFLKSVPAGKPFCFWFGSSDPHRPYERGAGMNAGLRPEEVKVPLFLPDTPEVRKDLLDYYFEIERFDREIGEMLKVLEKMGQLDNTIVVMTSDNGFPFPRGKANCYDAGAKMPLAMRWPERIRPGRVVDDFVNLKDLAPTFLEAAGLGPVAEMTGRSLMPLLVSEQSGKIDPARDFVVIGRERHANVRAGNVGYPTRAIRTERYLYLKNFRPERWPAGDPPIYGDVDQHTDIAGSPSKQAVVEHDGSDRARELFELAFGKRPAEEFYDLRDDPWQMKNVASEPSYESERKRLSEKLNAHLSQTRDPRVIGNGDVFDEYHYVTTPPRTNTKAK